jgi:hypothetical protein
LREMTPLFAKAPTTDFYELVCEIQPEDQSVSN